MEDMTCIVLGFLQRRNITDTLDKYVVLAFILTFLVTILVFFVLAKYITHNIRKDKERQKMIAERKVLPKRIEDEEEDSDDDFVWNDGSEEGDIAKHDEIETIVDTQDTTNSEVVFNTNYIIEADSSYDLNETQEKEDLFENDDDLDMKWLELWLSLDTNALHGSPFTNPFCKTSSGSNINIPIVPMYQENLFRISKLRETVFIQLTNFSIDILSYKRVLSQDKALFLKAKFEQEFERPCESLFSLSKDMVKILRMFLQDLKSLNVERSFMETFLSLVFNQQLNCLKIYLMILSGSAEAVKEQSEALIDLIANAERILLSIKVRFICFSKAVLSDQSTISTDFENEMKLIFSECQWQVQSILKSFYQNKVRNSFDLTVKIEQDINIVKYDLLNSSDNAVNMLNSFGESLSNVILNHLDESFCPVARSICGDIYKAIKQLKMLREKVTLQTEHAEKQLTSKLDYTEKKVRSISKSVHKDVNELDCLHDELINNTKAVLNQKLENLTKFLNLSIGYIVKFVSSQYRVVLSSNISFIKSWPSLPDQYTNRLEQSILGKMSMVSFDLVFGFVCSFLMEINDSKHLLIESLPCPQVEFGDDDSSLTEFIEKSALGSLHSSIQPFALPDQMISYNFKEHHSIVLKAYNNLNLNLKNLLKRHVQISCKHVFSANFEIFKASKANVRNAGSSKHKKLSQKYMSRRGSSFQEKTMDKRLTDLYDGMLDVQEHRFKEKINEQKQHETKLKVQNTIEDFLKNEIKLLEDKLGRNCRLLFETEQYYMREMLLKKIRKLNDEGEEEKEEDEDNEFERDKGEKVKKVKNPHNRIKSPKKAVVGAIKKRKSRKVGDVS